MVIAFEVTLTVRPEKLPLTRPEGMDNPGRTGVVREMVYIGTDTRFVVDLVSGGHIVARLQNIGSKGLGEFAVGDPVNVLWTCQDARAPTRWDEKRCCLVCVDLSSVTRYRRLKK